jgi:hypothetical protein
MEYMKHTGGGYFPSYYYCHNNNHYTHLDDDGFWYVDDLENDNEIGFDIDFNSYYIRVKSNSVINIPPITFDDSWNYLQRYLKIKVFS